MAAPVNNEVKGKLALVTGASGGIGSGCARALAAIGTDLALHYSRSEQSCLDLAEELRKEYPSLKITTHQADLSSAEQTERLCSEAVEKHNKPILILVPNAGVGKKIPHINDIPLEVFDETIQVNLRAPFIMIKAVVPEMQKLRFGRIITVSSVSAWGVGINGAHYACSKGGLQSMMRNLATRLGKDGITVNDVAPAMIGGTGMIPNEQSIPGVREQIPVGRLGTSNEVGQAVAMFAATGYINGQSLNVDGGLPHL